MLCSPKVFYDAVLPHPVQHGLLPGFDQKDEATDPDTFPVPSTATHVAVSAHPNRLTPDSLKKTCSAATRLQPLVVDTVDSKISLIFDDPVLLAMSIRTEVVCSGGGTTATDTRVSLMVSSLEIVVPWRPFKDTNNSCTVHVQAMARQFTSSHMLSYSAAMTNTIATIKQPLQFTVGQPGTFPVYLPSSFNMQQPASCSGDSTASAVCRTHDLDAPTHLLTSSPPHLLTSSPPHLTSSPAPEDADPASSSIPAMICVPACACASSPFPSLIAPRCFQPWRRHVPCSVVSKGITKLDTLLPKTV